MQKVLLVALLQRQSIFPTPLRMATVCNPERAGSADDLKETRDTPEGSLFFFDSLGPFQVHPVSLVTHGRFPSRSHSLIRVSSHIIIECVEVAQDGFADLLR